MILQKYHWLQNMHGAVARDIPHTAKCREANNSVIEMTGLTAAFSVLKSFFFFTEESCVYSIVSC